MTSRRADLVRVRTIACRSRSDGTPTTASFARQSAISAGDTRARTLNVRRSASVHGWTLVSTAVVGALANLRDTIRGMRQRRREAFTAVAIFIWLGALGTPAGAQDDRLLDFVRNRAERGNVEAQSALAYMYATGRNAPQDYVEAARWFRRAADQGDADAQVQLGLSYATGRGVPQHYAEAVRWFRQGADQGNAGAEYNLGVMHQAGRGVSSDAADAVQWFRRARHAGSRRRVGQPRSHVRQRGRGRPKRRVGPYVAQFGCFPISGDNSREMGRAA